MKFLLDHDLPDDLSYLIEQLGHDVLLLRKAIPAESSDAAVLQFAHDNGCILLTCNRNDFLRLAMTNPHHGVVCRRSAPNTGRTSASPMMAVCMTTVSFLSRIGVTGNGSA